MSDKPKHPLSTSTILGVIVGATVIAVAVIGAYVFNFHNLEISEKPRDWSFFGSYISGMLSPMLSFLSLIFVATTILRDNDWKDADFQREEKKRDDEKTLLRIEHIEKVQTFWLKQYQEFLNEDLNRYLPDGHDKNADYYSPIMTSMSSFCSFWKTISGSARQKLPTSVHESMTLALQSNSETLMMLLEFHEELSNAYKVLELPHYRSMPLGVVDLFDVLLNCDIESWWDIKGGKTERRYTPFKDRLINDPWLTHVMDRLPERLRTKYQLPILGQSQAES